LDTGRHSTAAIAGMYHIPSIITSPNMDIATNINHTLFLTTHWEHRHVGH
jgi:hypothetical protein